MKKILVTTLIVVAVIAIIYFIYKKWIKVKPSDSVVNGGESKGQTVEEFLVSSGVPQHEVDAVVSNLVIETEGREAGGCEDGTYWCARAGACLTKLACAEYGMAVNPANALAYQKPMYIR